MLSLHHNISILSIHELFQSNHHPQMSLSLTMESLIPTSHVIKSIHDYIFVVIMYLDQPQMNGLLGLSSRDEYEHYRHSRGTIWSICYLYQVRICPRKLAR